MNINTSSYLETIQLDIQKKIDMEQKRLEDIQQSLKQANDFLAENGNIEGESEDLLKDVMKTIKEMNEQTAVNREDIENILSSIKSLQSIQNNIDASIIESLKAKIKEIEGTIDSTNNKLARIKEYLTILLNLQIVCPVCNGQFLRRNQDSARFVRDGKHSCEYCDNIGVLSIGKILAKEGIDEVNLIEMGMSTNVIENTNPQMYNGPVSTAPKEGSGKEKYLINRQ